MIKKTSVPICIILFIITMAFAGDFSGNYVLQNNNSDITLNLTGDDKGGYKGDLKGNGNSFRLQGVVQDGRLAGTLGDDGILFEAEIMGDNLAMSMVEIDEDKNPIPDSAQLLIFQRQVSANIAPAAGKAGTGNSKIVINGVILTQQQITAIENSYGIKPRPGKFWYDAKSGLYGVVGYPAYGFMRAGHDFGPLDSNASNGQTEIIVNGRRLPQSEWTVWSYMLGYWIQPGDYWLDQNGNAGYQGNPTPVVNLYVAARQNNYTGSGDNFWSTRFGAGNSDSGNQRGYVSVPGHGPVGYGF